VSQKKKRVRIKGKKYKEWGMMVKKKGGGGAS